MKIRLLLLIYACCIDCKCAEEFSYFKKESDPFLYCQSILEYDSRVLAAPIFAPPAQSSDTSTAQSAENKNLDLSTKLDFKATPPPASSITRKEGTIIFYNPPESPSPVLSAPPMSPGEDNSEEMVITHALVKIYQRSTSPSPMEEYNEEMVITHALVKIYQRSTSSMEGYNEERSPSSTLVKIYQRSISPSPMEEYNEETFIAPPARMIKKQKHSTAHSRHPLPTENSEKRADTPIPIKHQNFLSPPVSPTTEDAREERFMSPAQIKHLNSLPPPESSSPEIPTTPPTTPTVEDCEERSPSPTLVKIYQRSTSPSSMEERFIVPAPVTKTQRGSTTPSSMEEQFIAPTPVKIHQEYSSYLYRQN